jgi:hypothetical protein
MVNTSYLSNSTTYVYKDVPGDTGTPPEPSPTDAPNLDLTVPQLTLTYSYRDGVEETEASHRLHLIEPAQAHHIYRISLSERPISSIS